MTIKISNGEVTIKSFVTRKLDKEMRGALTQGVENKIGEDGKTVMSGFKTSNMDVANDLAIVGMVEKIVINGEEKPVTIGLFDEMNIDDYDLIMAEINKLTKKKEIVKS